jgi:hypothetical protein
MQETAMNNYGKNNGKQRRVRKLSGGVTGKGFQPDQSGNTSGRPWTLDVVNALDAAVSQELPNAQTVEVATVAPRCAPGADKAAEALPRRPEKPLIQDVIARLQQAFATTDMDLMVSLLVQVERATGDLKSIDLAALARNFPVSAIHSIGARDGLEALLAVQMVTVHTLAMRFLANVVIRDQTDAGIELYTNRANRLLRTFTAQMEALKKHRSTGEQRVTVEHVTVESGGQAVVGAVNLQRARTKPNQGPGGGDKENVDQ